ncbi:benzoylformate decarboxylase [Spelaeicoccus albus]|uniref:Benzoylformate decarboxylase n=1 Tax=Spelaeicoccus albus TaxID=1280376 RepID=A0A7Z0D030_9MICO|nr:benzoylformate decarboxylase [Spelaeicoccus albus]NYI66941.1 benzoylformate decarboxylase [Spelaeicoccus albus]
MTTVKEATFELLRRHGLTTLFGNPGSNELPFLAGLPSDFRYVLGLHEGAVAGMADGYAQATGRPAFVNLHAAAGTGNAMGALTNAWYSHTPLVITAGQQVRSTIGQEVMLSNVDAPTLPRPLVKWSSEPADPSDVVRTLSQAVFTASADPQGPVYVSVPYDDWATDAGIAAEHLAARTVSRAGAFTTDQLADLTATLTAANNPVLVLGPDVDSARANDSAVRLAEALSAPVWVAPSAPRCPFPNRHPCFRGVLPAAVDGITRKLDGHDLIIVIGAPVFRYHEYDPGRYLPDGAELLHLTCDPGEAARAPMGSAVVVDIRSALESLAAAVPASGRPMPAPRERPAPAPAVDGVLTPGAVFDAINAHAPADAVYVNEATSTVSEVWDRIEFDSPGSYYFPASGGLGFGLPAAVGVQLADPGRRVIGLVGDGSANYGLSALWTAAQWNLPVVIIVLNNGTYGALRAFAGKLDATDAPGLDVPDIDFCSLAAGYGVDAHRTPTADEFIDRFTAALAGTSPVLLDVPIATVSPFED